MKVISAEKNLPLGFSEEEYEKFISIKINYVAENKKEAEAVLQRARAFLETMENG